MNILHANTTDTSGSAIAAKRLIAELRRKGVESKLLALDILGFEDDSIESFFDITGSKLHKIKALVKRHLLPSYYQSKLKNTNPDDNIFTYPNTLIDITQHHLYQKADIIHLHNVADFINIPQFFKKNIKPIVWTLHDLNPFTGGHHLPLSVRSIPSSLEKQSEINFKIKSNAYNLANKLEITAPSKWLMIEAVNSFAFAGRHIQHIPNGLDTNQFKPYSREFSRSLLMIPESPKKHILFIADDLRLSNKGADLFLQIYNSLKEKFKFVVAGKGSPNAIYHDKNIINLGYISSEYLLPIVYSSCDISLVLSKIETFSLTTLESLACGVPVLATNCKGPEEIIEEGRNGFVIKSNSPTDFIEKIDLILDNDELRQSMSQSALNRAQHFNISSVADKFIEIYQNLIEI